MTASTVSAFATPADLLPDGITVDRDVFDRGLVWIVYDRETRLATRVTVDPDDYLVDWEPPPEAPRWRRWLSPLGAALDSIDRAQLISRMRGTKVVDWDTLEHEAQRLGGDAIRSLLDARASRRGVPSAQPKSSGGAVSREGET